MAEADLVVVVGQDSGDIAEWCSKQGINYDIIRVGYDFGTGQQIYYCYVKDEKERILFALRWGNDNGY